MKLLKFYSQSGCQYECSIQLSSLDCGCTAWNFPQDPLQVCERERIACFMDQMRNVTKIQTCQKNCLPDCEQTDFAFTGPYVDKRYEM